MRKGVFGSLAPTLLFDCEKSGAFSAGTIREICALFHQFAAMLLQIFLQLPNRFHLCADTFLVACFTMLEMRQMPSNTHNPDMGVRQFPELVFLQIIVVFRRFRRMYHTIEPWSFNLTSSYEKLPVAAGLNNAVVRKPSRRFCNKIFFQIR